MDDYQIAIQSHKYTLKDPALQRCTVKSNSWGLPIVQSGGFALTYCLYNGKKWAVKCFHRERPDLFDRYENLNSFMSKNRNRFFVDFEYQRYGISVNNNPYPIVKMDWVDGVPLNIYVENNLRNSSALEELAEEFRRCVNHLDSLRMAHGDLQHGNIIIQDGKVKLIDYDGAFIPDLNYNISPELGHVNYQHPLRDEKKTGINIDRFSSIVIYLAITVLSQAGQQAEQLWKRYDSGENLLFQRKDFVNSDKSLLLRDIKSIVPLRLHPLIDNFKTLCLTKIEDIPSLEEFIIGKTADRPVETVDPRTIAAVRRRQYVLINALDTDVFLNNVGEVVEAVGEVTNIKRGWTKGSRRPYAFINFQPYSKDKKFFYIVLWCDALDVLKSRNINVEDYKGKWISATGLIGTYEGRPSIGYNDTVNINILGKEQADEILTDRGWEFPIEALSVPSEEEVRLKAEEEAKKRAELEAKRKREEAKAKKKAEEEAKRRAELEARLKAEEEARRKAEEEAKKKAEEEIRKLFFSEILNKAFRERKTVKIKYISNISGYTERLLDIYGIELPYFIGFCHLRKEGRTFTLDRIDTIEITDRDYDFKGYIIEQLEDNKFVRIPQALIAEKLAEEKAKSKDTVSIVEKNRELLKEIEKKKTPLQEEKQKPIVANQTLTPAPPSQPDTEEAKRKQAEEEAKRKAKLEVKRKAEEARKKAELEAKRRAEEEAERKAEEEESKKKEEATRREKGCIAIFIFITLLFVLFAFFVLLSSSNQTNINTTMTNTPSQTGDLQKTTTPPIEKTTTKDVTKYKPIPKKIVTGNIHDAVIKGNWSLVRSLVLDNTNLVNARDKYTYTPLHWAVQNGRQDITRFLLNNGASVNVTAKGDTPLHLAVKGGYKEIIELLLAKGADVNIKDTKGWTPLHQVSWSGHKDIVRLLLANDAAIKVKGEDGRTPLHLATRRGHQEIVSLLLDKGADINAKDKYGGTPLHLAAFFGHNEIAELLLAKGAAINEKDNDGNTSLHLATKREHKETVELLLTKGANINEKINNGMTPLHLAVFFRHSEITQLLLTKGADINASDINSNTPLHLAVKKGYKETVELLLTKGANINLKDKDDNTPLTVAEEKGYKEIIEILRKHGARE